MKYSLQSSFARWVLALFFVILALTIVGRFVVITGAIAYCDGFPFCAPSHPLGWLKQAHIFLVGVASVLMFYLFRKAWGEQRHQNVILPLTTILGVMFFGQALVGAMQVTQAYPPGGGYYRLCRIAQSSRTPDQAPEWCSVRPSSSTLTRSGAERC